MKFKKASIDDSLRITKIMTEAFNFDTSLHRTDTSEDGPPGYSDGSLAERFLSDGRMTTYLIVVEGTDIGFVNFRVKGTTGILEKFCISPDYIGRGFGFQAWQLLEQQEHCASWYLETPAYSIRNHRFYERCGFKKTGWKKYGEDSYSFVFEKNTSKEIY